MVYGAEYFPSFPKVEITYHLQNNNTQLFNKMHHWIATQDFEIRYILLEYLPTNNMNPLWILFKCVLKSNRSITSIMGKKRGKKNKNKSSQGEGEIKIKEQERQWYSCMIIHLVSWVHQGLLAKGRDVILDNFTDIK